MTEQDKRISYDINLFCVTSEHLKSGEQAEIIKSFPEADARRVNVLASLLMTLFDPQSMFGSPKITTMILLPTLIKEFAHISSLYLESKIDAAITNGEQMKAVKQVKIIVDSENPRIITEVLAAQLAMMAENSDKGASKAFTPTAIMAETLIRNSVQCKIMVQAIARLTMEQHGTNLSTEKPVLH